MQLTIAIFGITGDLAQQKLLPAIDELFKKNILSKKTTRILGISRRVISRDEAFRNQPEVWSVAHILQMDMENPADYQALKDTVDLAEGDKLLVYLSVPSSANLAIVRGLSMARLNDQRVKILFEKPFGSNEKTARELISQTELYFDEHQIFRIDHYLAKARVREIRTLPVCKKIEFSAFEVVDADHRADFYAQTGALRDMVQGHLLEVAATFLGGASAEKRAAILQKMTPADTSLARRSQYRGFETTAQYTETAAELTFFCGEIEIVLRTAKATDSKKTFVEYMDEKGKNYKIDLGSPSENQTLENYEFVIEQAIAGDHTWFVTPAEIIRCWQLVAPVLEKWQSEKTRLYLYEKNSPSIEVFS